MKTRECLMLLVKGNEAQATQALRDHGFETSDYRIGRDNTEVAFFVHCPTPSDMMSAHRWYCESEIVVPAGGLPVGSLLLYNGGQ